MLQVNYPTKLNVFFTLFLFSVRFHSFFFSFSFQHRVSFRLVCLRWIFEEKKSGKRKYPGYLSSRRDFLLVKQSKKKKFRHRFKKNPKRSTKESYIYRGKERGELRKKSNCSSKNKNRNEHCWMKKKKGNQQQEKKKSPTNNNEKKYMQLFLAIKHEIKHK